MSSNKGIGSKGIGSKSKGSGSKGSGSSSNSSSSSSSKGTGSSSSINKTLDKKWTDGRSRMILQYEVVLNECCLQDLVIFPSQEAEADRVFDVAKTSISRGTRVDMLVAPPQYGKTGIILAFVMRLLKQELVDLEDIYICTTHSSKMWLSQTRDRMPRSMCERIYHRNGMHTMAERVKERRRKYGGQAVIIVDESHIASQKEMTMDEMFKTLELNEPDSKVYMLEVTATPDGLLADISRVGNVVQARVNSDYTSFQWMLQEDRLRESFPLFMKDPDTKALCRDSTLKQMRRFLDVIVREFHDTERWHLVRLPTFMYGAAMRETIRSLTTETSGGLETRFYDMDVDSNQTRCINEVFLNTKPTKHTVIYVKDMLRCSDTLNLTDVGVMLDRGSNSTSVVAQSFAGRCNGYKNHDVVCFTNLQGIKDYIRAYDHEFNLKNTEWAWKSVTLNKSISKKDSGKQLFTSRPTANRTLWSNHEEEVGGKSKGADVYYVMGTKTEVNDSYNEHFRQLAGRRTHPVRWDHYINPTKLDEKSGLYMCNGPRGKPRVFSVADVLNDCRWGLNNDAKTDRRVMIAYDDPKSAVAADYKVIIFTRVEVPEWTRIAHE